MKAKWIVVLAFVVLMIGCGQLVFNNVLVPIFDYSPVREATRYSVENLLSELSTSQLIPEVQSVRLDINAPQLNRCLDALADALAHSGNTYDLDVTAYVDEDGRALSETFRNISAVANIGIADKLFMLVFAQNGELSQCAFSP